MITTTDMAKVTLDDTTLSVTRLREDVEGRTVYVWCVASDEWTFTGHDLVTGVGMDAGPLAMLATLCVFLEAAAESFRYGNGHGMFDPLLTEWADQYATDLAMVTMEISGDEDD